MSGASTILIVDDDESIRVGCTLTLEAEGYEVVAESSGDKGLETALDGTFDVILLDLKMPKLNGMDVLKRIMEEDATSIVVMITGYATIESAVEAMRCGAYDFIQKPFSPEELLVVVERAIDLKRVTLENTCLRSELEERVGRAMIIGRSPSMQEVATLIAKVASADSTVLVTGETGVGKELVGRAIHRASDRQEKPFVTVDCGALVETLFESELFGHRKGSFTGAEATTHGKFELANGGTVFLDEIGNIGTTIQAKLLRVIQEREITKVGNSQSIKVDVRIIAATNIDLSDAVNRGVFREDLYYRLNVFPIHIPPLRERREDIPELAQHFLGKYNGRRHKKIDNISDEAMLALQAYDWPGNVRELENAIERAVILTEGHTLEAGDLLCVGPRGEAANDPWREGRLAQMERGEIIQALKAFDGQKAKAADYLGINRKTLREKIRKYGIHC